MNTPPPQRECKSLLESPSIVFIYKNRSLHARVEGLNDQLTRFKRKQCVRQWLIAPQQASGAIKVYKTCELTVRSSVCMYTYIYREKAVDGT